MSHTIGRVVFTKARQWDLRGDRASIDGFLKADTQAEIVTLRQQLLGYANNPDEPIVPVVWATDPSADGFYRVLSATVAANPALWDRNYFRAQVELERISGYAAPQFESVLLGALRTNQHSITSSNSIPWWAVPSTATGVYSSAAAAFSSASRAGENATATFWYQASDEDLYDAVGSFWVAPASWYDVAGQVEAGATLQTVVGRQLPAGVEMDWRVGNDVIRVAPNGTKGRLDFEYWDGSAWQTIPFTIEADLGSGFTEIEAFKTVRVLRNSPEEATLRATSDFGGAAPSLGLDRVDVDIRVRRGARHVELFMAGIGAWDWRLGRTTAEAATALTGGIRATSNDANGDRYVISSPDAFTADTTNGRITTSTAPSSFAEFPAAVGIELDGSAATGTAAAQSIIYQYMAAQSERLNVVER